MRKNLRYFLTALAIAVLVTAVFAPLRAESPSETARAAFESDPAYRNHPWKVPGGIIVDFKDDATLKHIEKLEDDLNIDLKFVNDNSEKYRFMRAVVGDYQLTKVLDELRKDPEVEYAEPDYYYHAYAAKPNDPLYKYQWNFEKINVRGAWDGARGDGVIVAVIDTGVAYSDSGRFHRVEDLDKTLFVKGYNFVDKNDKPFDDNAHGTHVAGTIAQSTNNGKGVAGIAYRSKIMPLKVLTGQGYGKISDIAAAVRYAADHDAKVINMSLGGPFPSLALGSACKYAWDKGVVIVCAAGNSRSTRPGYPAGYKECLSVSSTRFDDKLAPYSNRGKSIDIAAPGGDTTVDQNGDGKPDGIMQNTISIRNPEKEGYYIFQGTSMASPHVAAVAALIASTGVTNNKQIVSILKKTARKDNLPLEEGYGAGIVDAKAAVFHSTVGHGWVKLLVTILLIIVIIIFLGIALFAKVKFSPLFHLGWLVSSGSLFFIALFFKKPFPGVGFLMKGIPEWDTLVFGPGSHANPLFYSALIPFVIAAFLYKTKFQKLAAGISLGTAANLLYALLFSSADVRWIPGTFILDKGWILLNFMITGILAVILIKTLNTNKKGSEKNENP